MSTDQPLPGRNRASFTNILIPLDGSSLAECALPTAVEFARRFKSKLTLLHVIEQGAPASIHGEKHLSDVDSASTYLDDIQRRLASEGFSVTCHVHPNHESDVAASIVGHAVEFGNDLIVLASHGSGGLRDVIVGSIAQQVLRRGVAPVLLLRPDAKGQKLGTKPLAEAFIPKRILVPLDGSHRADQALAYAESVALAFDAQVKLARVVPTSGSLSGERAAVAQMLPSATKEALSIESEDAAAHLKEIAGPLAERGVKVTIELPRGDTVSLLTGLVEREGIDLVVLATHGRSGLGGFWAGSVGTRLVERIASPLLVIRTEGAHKLPNP